MAVIRHRYCMFCEVRTSHINDTCVNCARAATDKLRLEEQQHWDGLSLEEKVEWLRDNRYTPAIKTRDLIY